MVRQLDTPEEFASALRNPEGKLVAVDFTATWCGPCTKLTRTPRGFCGVRTGGAGRLVPRAPRTVRTGYAYQPWAFGTYSIRLYCGTPGRAR